jgi:hypothetical protein
MNTRVRSRELGSRDGFQSFDIVGPEYYSSHVSLGNETVSDEHEQGVRTPHMPLRVSRSTRDGGLLNGPGPRWSAMYANYPTGAWFRDPQNLDLPTYSENDLALRLLAGTNPSRPKVDLPVSVFELRELPELIRTEGLKRLRNPADIASSLYLKEKFGFEPIFNDLVKLCSFVEAVERKFKTLTRLHDKGFSTEHLKLEDDAVSYETDWQPVFSTLGLFVDMRFKYTSRRDIRGYVVWKLDNPFIADANIGVLRRAARNLVLGLYAPGLDTLWNALPWTWLLDWCSNIGTILEASRNTVGATPVVSRLLYKDTNTVESVAIGGGFESMTSPYKAEYSVLERKVPLSIALAAELPILTGSQFSILSSIGWQRYSGRRR